METNTHKRKHWYPASSATHQPSNRWYFGRAVYVSRHEYRKIFLVFIAVGIPLLVLGCIFPGFYLLTAAFSLAGLGFAMLIYSLIGLYRQYGNPANAYFEKLLAMEQVSGAVQIADIHIGTYRHSYKLAELLSEASIYSIDYWNENWPLPELAIQDVRDLEFAPLNHAQIHAQKQVDGRVPLKSGSCDYVVLGFGAHEINAEGARKQLFDEVERILKPGGKVLMFEHGYDFHNYLIFGPVIYHVTTLRDWKMWFSTYFNEVKTQQTSHAVNLLSATKK